MQSPQATDWNRFWKKEDLRAIEKMSWSKRRIVSVLERHIVDGTKALDAGCGSGFFAGFFCRRGLETWALDYSEQALEMAGEMTRGQARLVRADLLKPGLDGQVTEQFDVIFSDGLFEHFSELQQDRILANLKSVLTPGGKVITVVPNRWSPWELIRPLYMPGIEEDPFVLSRLVDLHERNGLRIREKGGLNTLPFRFSPEGGIASVFGMLLYAVAENNT